MSKAFLYGVGRKPALLGSKSITENGTYLASIDNLDGYDSVEVSVSGGGGGSPDPMQVYSDTRPADWLPINLPSEMESLYPDEDRVEILFEIAPDVNVITFEITSTVVGVTVDWGDGTTSTSDTTTYAFSKQYGILATPQVLIVISTTKGNIKGVDFNKTYTYQNADGTSYSLDQRASSNIVEVSINASSCFTLILGASTLAISFYKLRYFSAETIFNTAPYMFYNCHSLITIPMLNTIEVANMSSMFNGCNSLTTIPMLNTIEVANMSNMFYGCNSLTTIPMLNTIEVANMSNMFYGCNSLTTIPMLNTINVTNMSYMFRDCYSLTTIPMLNTIEVANMSNMFTTCYSLTTIPSLNTGKVTSTFSMFNGCNSLTTIPMLNTINVTNMGSMFSNCYNITHSNIIGAKRAHSYVQSLLLSTSALVEILNNLGTVTVATILTLGAANLAKLSPEQKQIALDKGWTLA